MIKRNQHITQTEFSGMFSIKTNHLCRKRSKKIFKIRVLESLFTFIQPPHLLKVRAVSVYEKHANKNHFWVQEGSISNSRLHILKRPVNEKFLTIYVHPSAHCNQGFHQQFCCLLKFSKISKNQQKNVCWFLLSKTAKRMPTMIFWWNNSLFKGKFQNSINIFSYFWSLILTNWFFYLN